MWTVRDAATAASHGATSVAVATEHFVSLAHQLAVHEDRPKLRVMVLPFPLEGLPDAELARIAESHYPSLLECLGVIP
jgi:hypothetical protein